MSEESFKLPMRLLYFVGGLAGFSGLAIVGALLYVNWEQMGLPTAKEFVEEVEVSHTGVVPGAVVVEGNPANFAGHINRDDVFVVVNFYVQFDENNENVLLDLKRLSARHEGKVVILNTEARFRGSLGMSSDTPTHPDVRLVHAGKQLGQFTGDRLVWEMEAIVTRRMAGLTRPPEETAGQEVNVDPYAESLRRVEEGVLPSGVAPSR